MNHFERALEDCLDGLARGDSLEKCLQRHPEFAGELRPALMAARRLERAQQIRPPAEFKSRARAQLMAFMRTHPRRQSAPLTQRLRPVWQFAVVLAVFVAVFFFTGTALAQSALPGSPLYGWKLTSETVWRAVSLDPVATDLVLAERRVQELQAVSGSERDIALEGYQRVLVRLENQVDPAVQEKISSVLTDQRAQLAQYGISVPVLNEYLSQPGSRPSPLLQTPTPQLPIQTPQLPIQTPELPVLTPGLPVLTPGLPIPTPAFIPLLEIPVIELPHILKTPSQ